MTTKENFILAIRGALHRQFEKLYLPKLPDAHLSRVVMWECINTSADTGYHIESLSVTRRKNETDEIVTLILNGEVRVDFYIPLTSTP
jgi:hypothetical protein